MRKTKIICTIGPATGAPEVLRELIRAGMDVARLNFSHGETALFAAWIRTICKEAAAQGKTIAILQDLPGPKLRTGPVRAGEVTLISGDRFFLRTDPDEGSSQAVHIDYPGLPAEVKKGDPIFIDDGQIRLKVLKSSASEIETEVIGGGTLRGRRGMNVPESRLSLSAVSPQDLRYLDFGLAQGVDWVALSFVRRAADIETIRSHCLKKGKIPRILAKIERREALLYLEEIIEASDGVMVARGDLGVEIPVEQVPLTQKKIIRLANQMGKPVVTATQMLESMVARPWATRAEVADVANAVLDGTDAVMLSQETSIGAHPLEAVRIMGRVTQAVEDQVKVLDPAESAEENISEAVVHGAIRMAERIRAGAIVAITRTGKTARRLSAGRPSRSVIAIVPNAETARALMPHRGVFPCVVADLESLEGKPVALFEKIHAAGMLKRSDPIVLTGGIPFGAPGSTSFARVLHIPPRINPETEKPK